VESGLLELRVGRRHWVKTPANQTEILASRATRFVRLALLSKRRNVVCLFVVEVLGMHPPPSAELWQIATGYLLPRCLHVVAELGVADH
jgi:hypothetical protein